MTQSPRHLAQFAILILFAVMSAPGHAQLVIEITRGQTSAIPIAIVPFGSDSASLPIDVAEVISADLARSGRFAPLERRDMVDKPTNGTDIRFQDWKYLKSDYIAVGKVFAEAGNYSVQFELYNVLNGKRMLGQRIPSTAAALRGTAHRIADMIYEQLTGTPGAFATRIAFIRVFGQPPAQRYELIVADSDAQNQVAVAKSGYPIMSPAWSPDGKSLAYVSFEDKASAIYVQTLATGERRRVSARAGINGAPAWSPDAKTLAITLSRKDGDVDVYTLDLAAQVLTRMSFDSGIDTEPTWSADGKKIYFTSDRAGGPQIYEVEVADPRSPRRITFEGTYNARPRLSPDGKKLAVVHRENGNDRIGIVDLASKAVQVVSNGRDDESPSFAPNGAMLMYATQTRGRSMLKVASTTGNFTGEFQLEGDVREPAWSPFPQR